MKRKNIITALLISGVIGLSGCFDNVQKANANEVTATKVTPSSTSLKSLEANSKKVEEYLTNQFGNNPRIVSIKVKVIEVKPFEALKGWGTYIVSVEASLKAKPKELIKQKMIWFSNGTVVSKDLANTQTGESYVDSVKPDFQESYYSKENLIYGDANATHKIAIFSDPLCPFCKSFAPQALTYMKKYPKKFAVYYYHYPILRIHPASAIVIRAAVVAEDKGIKDVAINMYKIKIDVQEKNVQKILKAFNKVVGSHVTQKEILSKAVAAHIAHDDEIAKNIFVGGTPTVYVDNKIDKTREKYKRLNNDK